MSYIAVDKSGVIGEFKTKPVRIKNLEGDDIWFDGNGVMVHPPCKRGFFTTLVWMSNEKYLKKLIGRNLTWEDEPVELKK
jgi:hypothetical protein